VKKAEILGLTGIRFYAAAAVFVTHAVEKIPGGMTLEYSTAFLNAGAIAVSFFFVLSGFILTYKYEATFRDGVTWPSYIQFVWHRLTRLYPVHLLMLFLVLPIAILSPNNPVDWRALPFHLTLLQCWWPSLSPKFWTYFNTPSWSISCELLFYVAAPLAMFLILKPRHQWIQWVVIVAYLCGLGWFLMAGESDGARIYYMNWFAPSRFIEFLAGIYLAKVFLVSRSTIRPPYSVGMQVFGMCLMLAGAIGKQYCPWLFQGGLLIIPGSALLIMGLAYGHGYFVAHLSHAWVHRLGIASFSFYLIHDPLLRALRGACFYLNFVVHSWEILILLALVMFVLAQTAALLVCRYYEIPLQTRLRACL